MVTWAVTGQQSNRYSYDGSGTPVLGHEVSFVTGNGNRDSVFIPDDHYNTQAVRAAINMKAKVADEVGALTSGE